MDRSFFKFFKIIYYDLAYQRKNGFLLKIAQQKVLIGMS